MNNNILIWDARRVVEKWTLVDWYDAVTPFGKEGQEGPPPLPPETLRDGRPELCWAVNARQPTSWMRSLGTMGIVVLPRSKSDIRFLPWPSIFNVCDDNVTTKKSRSTLQSQRRGGHITFYWGAASSYGPKWQSSRIIFPGIYLGRTLQMMNPHE